MAGGSETGAQLFARLGSRPSLQELSPPLFANKYPKPGELVEICGESGTAKTEILINFIVTCILPKNWKGYHIGGIDAGVVFVDTQCQFSMLRVFSLLEKRVSGSLSSQHLPSTKSVKKISDMLGVDLAVEHSSEKGTVKKCKESYNPPNAQEIEDFIKSCLEKLYVIRCHSSQQLLITLHSLENFIASKEDMNVLMIDSWSAFYWIDRANFGDQMSLTETRQKALITAMQKILKDQQVTAFVTKSCLFRPSGKSETKQHGLASPSSTYPKHSEVDKSPRNIYEFGPKEWNKLVTHRLILDKTDQPVLPSLSGLRKQSVFVATRALPKEMETEVAFQISEKGLCFMNT